MRQTDHYGLCQWDATDRVLRTDFNEDNAKIDTAVATAAAEASSASTAAAAAASAAATANTEAAAARSAAAAAAARSNYTKIKEVTTSTLATQVDLDVSDIDWSQWKEVYVYATVLCSTTSPYILRCNSSISCVTRVVGFTATLSGYLANPTTGADSGYAALLEFKPFGNSNAIVNCVGLSGYNGRMTVGGFSSLRFRDLQTMNFLPENSSNGGINAGSNFVMWGVK